jgi:hypothetical protein
MTNSPSFPQVANRPGTSPAPRPKAASGRPRKFRGPSRPVTITLPDSTLKALERIDPDRSIAIVKLTDDALRRISSAPPVELVEMAENTALLIVGPSKALRRIPFLHLVEVAPGRFLIALDPGNNFTTLEIAIQDALEDVPEQDIAEREMIRQLLARMKDVRKAERVSMAEILFVDLSDRR